MGKTQDLGDQCKHFLTFIYLLPYDNIVFESPLFSSMGTEQLFFQDVSPCSTIAHLHTSHLLSQAEKWKWKQHIK